MKAQVMGIGHALPRRILDNKELEQRVDTSEKWILDRTGIRERRIIDPEQTTSDIACQAAKMALEHAGIGIEDLDLIIVATATPTIYLYEWSMHDSRCTLFFFFFASPLWGPWLVFGY
jgi:3-oxoacyl-[acyl-carrier-protein] synthase-3